MSKAVLMQGNEAIVEGAIAAGMGLFAGYPITPSTEIAELAALRLPQVGGCFLQMEDEIASMAAAIGASAAGVKAMTASSGPGMSLKQENLGYAAMAELPCVVVNVQRAGPSTGLPTSPAQGDLMQARWGCHGDHPIIAISPSSVREAYTETVRAFNLAEKYRQPVILLTDEMIGHLREGVELPEALAVVDRSVNSELQGDMAYHVEPGRWAPEMAPFGEGQHYHVTGLFHDDAGFPRGSPDSYDRFIRRLCGKIEQNRDDIESWEEYRLEDAETAVVCFGGCARAVQAAVDEARLRGRKVGMLRPITVWPFPERAMAALAGRVKCVLAVELNSGQMLREVERAAAGQCPVHFLGRFNGQLLDPDEILARIEEVG